jgi:hypothetical protein
LHAGIPVCELRALDMIADLTLLLLIPGYVKPSPLSKRKHFFHPLNQAV